MAFKDLTTTPEILKYLRDILSRIKKAKNVNDHQLYHYTNIETIEKIASTGYIWLGSADTMNDYFEQEVIKKNCGDFNRYFVCFSRAEENLAMYKMYAPSPDGAMLKISYDDLKKIIDRIPRSSNKFHLVNIVRNNVVTEEKVEADVFWTAVAYKELHSDLIYAGEAKNKNINHPFKKKDLAGCIKFYGWEYEKEVRLCANLKKSLKKGERIAIKLPDDIKLNVVTGPGFDEQKNRSITNALRMNSVVIQQSEYSNLVKLGFGELEEIKRLRSLVDDLKKEIEIRDQRINNFISEYSVYQTKGLESLIESKDNEIIQLNNDLDNLAGFSYTVSNFVNHLTIELKTTSMDVLLTKRVTDFLQKSINTFEELLSSQYHNTISANIKFGIEEDTLKSFIRGRNNVESRKGFFLCPDSYYQSVRFDENYGYHAVIADGYKYFSEGNLKKLSNPVKENDVYFCEYGESYTDIMLSAIVIPLKVPVYEKNRYKKIIGLLCIDCKDEIPEWSDKKLPETRAYHIISNYAESIAMMMREYNDAAKKNI